MLATARNSGTVTLNKRRPSSRTLVLRLSSRNNKNVTHKNNREKLNNNSDKRIDQEPMADQYISIEEENEDHNSGNLQIEQSQKRASFYLPRLIDYVKPIDNTNIIPAENILGLIIHYPDELPMAFDYTTSFQYGMFPAIKESTGEENQPIMLITTSGFQEIHANDIREKYNDTLTKLFSNPQ